MSIFDFFRTKRKTEDRVDQTLYGRAGASVEWGSGWLDLLSPADFKKGDGLRLTLEGSAKKVLIRLLPQGSDPNQPVGIVSGSPFEVPESKIVTLKLGEDHQRIGHISVHGGAEPWGILLGAGNGPATLLRVEHLPQGIDKI